MSGWQGVGVKGGRCSAQMVQRLKSMVFCSRRIKSALVDLLRVVLLSPSLCLSLQNCESGTVTLCLRDLMMLRFS